jgi:hypothetical protein
MSVEFLAHSKVATFSNPSAPDFCSYIPEVKDRFRYLMHKWLDLFAFLRFDIQIKSATGRMGMAVDSARRVLDSKERPK